MTPNKFQDREAFYQQKQETTIKRDREMVGPERCGSMREAWLISCELFTLYFLGHIICNWVF